MTRFLVVLILLLYAAYLASRGLEHLRQRLSKAGNVSAGERHLGHGELVACANCGVHVPRSRALEARESVGTAVSSRFYCSEGCRLPARPVSLESQSGAA